MLPRPYTASLQRLCDKMPPQEFARVQRAIEHELQAPLATHFKVSVLLGVLAYHWQVQADPFAQSDAHGTQPACLLTLIRTQRPSLLKNKPTADVQAV